MAQTFFYILKNWDRPEPIFRLAHPLVEEEGAAVVARSNTMHASIIHHVPCQLAQDDEFTTTCYEKEIPPFVEAELDRCYGSLFSSLLHFRIKGKLTDHTSTYVRHRGQDIIALLLFEHKEGKVTVLNDLIEIGEEEVDHFVNYIFGRYASVTAIYFPTIQTHLQHFPYPYQQFFSTEDIVISLPNTEPAYLHSLGKNTRRNIKRYNDAIMRSYPSYRYKILPNDEVDDELIRRLISFNKLRMADKNKISSVDDEQERWIIALAKTCGLVGVVTIDGRICAGSICCRVKDNYYMLVIGHDPRYNEFSLGTLSCYRMICECINQGGKELHFMWGRLDYKYTFLGVQRGYDRVDVYRTRKDLLRNAGVVMKTAITGHMHEAKFWLLDCERKDDPTSKIAAKVLNVLRQSKNAPLFACYQNRNEV
jgi:hypothetical protein